MGSQDSHFLDFWWEGWCNPLFHRFFMDFWLKNLCFFRCFFRDVLAIFWTWRPSQSIDIYESKHTFSFFWFFIFLRKNAPKSRPKKASKKEGKNVALGSLLGPQNGLKWGQGRPKVSPKSKNKWFLRGQFFDDFLDGKKITSRGHSTHWGMSVWVPRALWGTIGGRIKNNQGKTTDYLTRHWAKGSANWG